MQEANGQSFSVEHNGQTFTPTEAVINEIPKPLLYPLDAPDFRLHFPVKWPGKEGRLEVVHKLKRPTAGQLIEFKRLATYERRTNKDGGIEESANNAAAHWLWDQIALEVGGYPGLPDGLTPVDASVRAKMRGRHKEDAINHLLAADAEVIESESAAFFDGGEWAVRLKIGRNLERPDFVLNLRFREWTEKERQAFERHGAKTNTRNEGKVTITKTSINLAAFVELFDALMLTCDGAGINGRPAMEAGREAVCAGLFAEWKMLIVTELARTWKADLLD